MLKTLEADYKELDEEKRDQDKHERLLSIAKAKAETSTKTALSEVKNLAESLSSRSTIRLNFDERRKESRGIIGEKRKEFEELNKKHNLYSRTMVEIDSFIDVRAYDSAHNYIISKNIKEDLRGGLWSYITIFMREL